MRKHKVLQIVVEGNTGSTGTIAESIGRIAISEGWSSVIAYGRFPRPSQSKLYKIGNKIDFYLHVIYTRLTDKHGFGSKRATKKLIKFIESEAPSIIHLHHIHGYYVNIQLLFACLSKLSIPVVWTFHDCWSFTGHCCHFDDIGCDKWQTECNNCPQLMEYPKSVFVDGSKRNYYLKKELFNSLGKLVIVSVSKWLDGLVERSFLKKNRHMVIYNGVDTEVFKPIEVVSVTEYSIELQNKFIILGVSSIWNRKKGFDDFLELSKLLKPDEHMVMIGLSDDQLVKLPSNILGIRKTEDLTELVKFYNFAQVFVNPSVEETFGLTTAEALSCGTPAIVYNSTACPEVVDEKTGFVVDKGNVLGINKCIELIRSNGKGYYSNNCRSRILEKYNKNDQYNEYIALYKELVDF